MKWKVIDVLVFSQSKTCLAVCTSYQSLKLMLWYSGEYFLNTSNILEQGDEGYFVNGRYQDLTILRVTPFTQKCGISTDSSMVAIVIALVLPDISLQGDVALFFAHLE